MCSRMRRVGCQNPKIAMPMRTRWRYQGGDALDQLQRREHQICLFAAALRLGAVIDQIGAALTQPATDGILSSTQPRWPCASASSSRCTGLR